MGGLVNKGINEKQRNRMRSMNMKERMEEAANREKIPPTRDENICKYCSFKARYKFHRCPQCGEALG
ncbi:MAG TPA: hypothetical protein VJB11_01770 [archaeon]|nr:hypothetical protein [archaeon]